LERIAPLVRRIDELSAAYVCHVQENQGQALCSVERHEGVPAKRKDIRIAPSRL
jgi:hypothetical protein